MTLGWAALLGVVVATSAGAPGAAADFESPIASSALEADERCNAASCGAVGLSALQVRTGRTAAGLEERMRDADGASSAPKNIDIIALAMQAYIFGFPLTEMYKSRGSSIAEGNNVNSLYRASVAQVSCNFTQVVTPNVDTAYTSAFLELSNGPMVLTVPLASFPANYYWMVQFLDAFTNSFAYAGALITASNQSTFVITGPAHSRSDFCGATSEKPALCVPEVAWFTSTTNLVWLLSRYLNTADVEAYQNATKLTPLEKYDAQNVVDSTGIITDYPAYDNSSTVSYFTTLNTALQELENLTARPQDASLLASLARAGIGNNQSFAMVASQELVTSLSSISSELQAGMKAAKALVKSSISLFTTTPQGWRLLPPSVGDYGNDFLTRAAIAQYGFGANSEEYAMYDSGETDSNGSKLFGLFRYKIYFSAAPPIKSAGFWSVTAYETQSKELSCNGANYSNGVARYSINSQTSILSSNGTFTLYLQATRPVSSKQYQNWLPVPSGSFYLILRIYNPDSSVVDRTWLPPAIQRSY